ncbi:hypothetical protein NBRC3257_2646 [Gluconobacter thailandicus NBRC 3257]|uniref:Uncharacterized protein n=1 Tax=Gluconobacter thailandicus NBRC 3257 TaxID=1381097 RepID=A0ABQ0IZM8_GLUTH|nr:hypothetical protein NBRC3255_2130 [Gluconobacter thailandicus NBRC 3255]GAD27647.1 hypothetical protein NBRC3257_2646 [Gluconobacter thailandicus NBRC 3257]GBR61692.1 hypothetical protein AA100600_3023 [Gluconobacter thailandicus F149-1 = NBRC 100600]
MAAQNQAHENVKTEQHENIEKADFGTVQLMKKPTCHVVVGLAGPHTDKRA